MSDSQHLEDFLEQLEADITGRVHSDDVSEAGAIFREDVFTELVVDGLLELGEAEDINICFFDKKYGRGQIRVNGWSINEDIGRLTLVTSLYTSELKTSVVRKDVELAVQRAVRVYQAAKDKYHDAMEAASDAYSMIQRISEAADSVLDIRVLVLTSGISTSAVDKIKLPETMPPIKWDVWDLVRLERALSSGKSYEPVQIDLRNSPTGPLRCLRVPAAEPDLEVYLAIIPGEFLFRLYEEHGSKLLELNVRSFLQARGKVNSGIRDTIRRYPERFLAYNNGIAITVEKISTVGNGEAHLDVVSMSGFQVVNGGQTMASIHRARKIDQADLGQIFVQAKITVVPTGHELSDEYIRRISEFSNTQNKINTADFSSNEPLHVEIQRLSERIWCPGEQTRWFYERARGQYQVARQRLGTTPARRRKFDETTPSSSKFDKTSMAKYINAWNQLPHVVSLGNQKNFTRFMVSLRNQTDSWLPDEEFYRGLIAKAIIFKRAEKIARQHKFPAYRANAVAYTVALISYKTFGRIRLEEIWKTQEISDAFADTLYSWMPQVHEEIQDSANGRNVTEWCKKEECWRTVQTMDIQIPESLQNELSEGQPLPTVGSKRGKRGDDMTHEDRENIARTMRLTGEDWLNVYRWTLHEEKEKWVSGIAHTLCGYAASDWNTVPSVKQARQAVKMLEEYSGEFGG